MGIDATSQSVAVGLSQKGTFRSSIYLNNGAPGSETLLKSIDHLLLACKIDKTALEGICLSLGPGSFTSMRISLSTAQALGFGLNIPLYDTNSLILIAETLPFYSSPLKVIKNAYKGELYTATYDTSQGQARELESLMLITPQALVTKLNPGEIVLGDIDLLRHYSDELKEKDILLHQSVNRIPSGLAVIEHFAECQEKPPSVIPLEPIYIRPSEAEVNYKKQFGVQ